MDYPQYTAERFFAPPSEQLRFLPEGPRVLQTCRGLGWVAIQHCTHSTDGSINILDLESRANRTIPLSGRPGFFVETRRPGVLLVGLERQLVLFDLNRGRIERVLVDVTDDKRVIINEGIAVDGGVLFGTKDLEFKRPIGAVYHFDARTGQLRTLITGQVCSNGKILWRNRNGFRLIDIDSAPKAISRYQIDQAFYGAVNESVVARPEDLPGFPDGMRSVSQFGCETDSALVAFYNPSAVADGVARQISLTDGTVLCEWLLPGSPRVTCPEFVEIAGKVKVIFTTAVEGMSDDIRAMAPAAGELYVADTPPSFRMPGRPPLLDL